jgi:hypothetical protein
VLAILTRRDLEMAHKAAAQQLRIGKAAMAESHGKSQTDVLYGPMFV